MLRRALCTDQLTTVLNRRHFFELAQEAFRNAEVTGQPVSAIMVDADHFKAVNDTHGHAAGDAVLVGLAKVLRAGVRANQDLVARLGGEEFSILLPGLDAAEAVEVAERLRHALRLAVFEAVDKEGEPVRLKVTASFGVSERTPDIADPEALLHRADAALYVAKAAGRNRVETR
jgi:diguanylate cyclase (GGDEF)-like protein